MSSTETPQASDAAAATASPGARLAAWERASSIPLAGLALVFLVAYAWHVLDAGRHPELDVWLTGVDVAVWVIFVADYLTRLWLADDRRRFVLGNPVDLVIVLLPPLRPLRLLRAALLVIEAIDRHTRFRARARMSVMVGLSSILLIVLCSLAMYDAERGAPESNIENFGDAAWWSVVSVTTVGYGDRYPVTVEGRLVALALMTFGIGLISFAIGTTTSWVMDKLKTVEVSAERTDREIGVLVEEIRSLRAEVSALRTERADSGEATVDVRK
ncbi:potassium channel family protein [Nocardia huaxiensis]|uniref:potassium channel family protein n=1 Tax=Nocardia huaxiensis TaxID=2755382 RepID=UPI001E4F3313|nr:potassium channel family protein [Nocardia huaxiensis]UFS99255.1 potassium channel family protein [Nocardia huaxiensis]